MKWITINNELNPLVIKSRNDNNFWEMIDNFREMNDNLPHLIDNSREMNDKIGEMIDIPINYKKALSQ